MKVGKKINNVSTGTLQIYAFRTAPGDVAVRFRQTLLREWIAPPYQETQVASPPAFGRLTRPTPSIPAAMSSRDA